MSKTERRPRLTAARKLELYLATRSADAPLGEILRQYGVHLDDLRAIERVVESSALAGHILALGHLPQHICYLHIGMVIPFLVLYYRTVNCFFRTPLKACVTSLTMMLPYRLVINHFDISYWANLCTDPTAVAFLI